ncbi:MAG TPA: hypothetical protein VK037_08975 [Pseudogracilibacillus sp.]|nr:hypothetical protein [Pseudogracilibacillus sp.]
MRFFSFIAKDLHFAKQSGLLGEKTQVIGDITAISYIDTYGQMISVGGIIVYGFVMSWVFGREYADRTMVSLLAIPY